MDKNFEVGDLVRSIAGHDLDRIYVVMRLEGEFVFLSDGEYRPVSKLKRKNIKHLKYAFDKQTTTTGKTTIGGLNNKPTDANIKKIIKNWRAYAERR